MISFMYEFEHHSDDKPSTIHILSKKSGAFIGLILLKEEKPELIMGTHFVLSVEDVIQIAGKMINPFDDSLLEDIKDRWLRAQRQLGR